MAYFETIYINEVYHKVCAIKYDSFSGGSYPVKLFMVSFNTKQIHDNFLAGIQKGITFSHKYDRFSTSPKSYISNLKKCSNDNTGDGWHALIYSEDEDVVIVNRGEDIKDKMYEHLKAYKSGILPEWKDYFYDELISYGCITKCNGFDLTGGYCPEVYMMKNIDTDLMRTIKSNGIKSGKIRLPVDNNKELDTNMEFIEIIEQLILPYIDSEKAYYNVGEEDTISGIIKSPIKKGNKMVNLFPRQQIIAQGILNFFKDGNNTCIFNGGTGIGKTFTTCKLSYAVIKEIFKRDSGFIGVFCQGHLVSNWENEFVATLGPLKITPKIHVITNYKDISKLPKKPNGIEIIIFPKDIVKMNYDLKHSGVLKYDTDSNDKIKTFIRSIGKSNSTIEIASCIGISNSKIRYATALYTKEYKKKILFHKKVKKSNGDVYYLCTTNSATLKDVYGTENKSYDFIVSDLKELKDRINKLNNQIASEGSLMFNSMGIENYITCPCCGGKIYESSKHIFDNDKCDKYKTEIINGSKTGKLARCNNYVKADGTHLTERELSRLRIFDNYVIVEKYSKVNYVDENGTPLTGNELQKAKRDLIDYKLQIRKCNHPMYGFTGTKYKTSKDGRNIVAKNNIRYNSAKYLRKLYGDGYLDICIFDESHVFNRASDQGYTMGILCKASKINILLSGTITGGKASDLYKTFWRTNPSKMKSLGYDYKDEKIFVDHYGRRKRKVVEKEVKDYNSTKSGQTRMESKQWDEMPGISPLLYNNFLSGIMVSRKIEDMGIPLPRIVYIKEEVEMTEEQQLGYNKLKSDLNDFCKRNPKIGLGGIYTKKLKSYPDYPRYAPIYVKDTYGVLGPKGEKIYVATPEILDISKKPLPKEMKLLQTLAKEIRQKRKVIVYTEFTGLGVSKRLCRLLSKFFNVREFTTKSCKNIKDREITIEAWAEEGVDVIICNPVLVSTGLNLMSYPTMYFFDQPYDVKTIRQAEKRAYRPLQTKECRVYYAFYRNCIQEDAIKLIGTKKRASEALEGVFSNDCLSAMGDGGDSIESVLNKVLDGKIELKESDLDNFNFETVDYDIIEVEEEDIKEVIEKVSEEKTTDNNIFEANTSLIDQLNKLKELNSKKPHKKNSTDLFSKLNELKSTNNNSNVEKDEEVAATKHEQMGFGI